GRARLLPSRGAPRPSKSRTSVGVGAPGSAGASPSRSTPPQYALFSVSISLFEDLDMLLQVRLPVVVLGQREQVPVHLDGGVTPLRRAVGELPIPGIVWRIVHGVNLEVRRLPSTIP